MTAGGRIAIIGGGPGGLTLARLLSLQGIEATVLERDRHAGERLQGDSLDLHPDTGLRAMRLAGLENEFWATASPEDHPRPHHRAEALSRPRRDLNDRLARMRMSIITRVPRLLAYTSDDGPARGQAPIGYGIGMSRGLMIEFRQIRYFLAAAEHGSFRKAASAAGVNESAVSRRVRDLEDQLGASLFQRHNGGVYLTVAGQRFVRHARKALQQISQGAKHVAAIGRSEDGHIKVGIFSSLASGFLAELLREYDKMHARVRIEFIDGDPLDHVSAIRQLRLDVAFITGTSTWAGCETDQLWSERVFAVLPSDHPLCDKRVLDWHDFAGELFIVSEAAPGPEIQDYLVQRLAGLGRHPEIHAQCVGRDNLLSLVAIGRGLTLTSEATTVAQFPRVSYRPIANEILPFSAVWSPRNDNPACRRLLSLARAMARSRAAMDINFPASICPPTSSPPQNRVGRSKSLSCSQNQGHP